MVKKIFLSTSTVFILMGCGGSSNNTNTPVSKSTHLGIDIEDGNSINPGNKEKKSYIPKGEKLTQEMAYKFLNMTTFGATPTLANELRNKGVETWVEEQLSMPYIPKTESILRGTLELAEQMRPTYLQGNSIDDIMANNETTVTKGNYIEWEAFVSSSLFHNMLKDKSQLRQRVAYALSQTIIASDSVDSFFRYSFHALAYYYDFLIEHAFGNYEDVLYDVSMSPAMATFLTYHGNRKTYTNKQGKLINPDENYGRELMQLFSLGLYQLNIDGMQKSDGSQFLETYTQKDINNMSRVFTGLTYPNYTKFGAYRGSSDLIHPMACEETYHDMEEKNILGTSLPAGQSCEEDIKSAIQVLMKHENIAPYISKKLILRLTKSNPKAEYIQRVAQVFNDNGNGIKGDLKAVVKAILLDKEIWENITKGFGTKIKEPYIAHTGMLRAFNVQALPTISYYSRKPKYAAKHFDNTNNKLFLYQQYTNRYAYKSFAQSPLLSPTVFNFYEDTFVPNNKMMRMYSFVAPELQIQTTPYIIKFSQRIDRILTYNDKGGNIFMVQGEKKYNDSRHMDGFIIDSTWVYDEALKVLQGDFKNITSNSDTNTIKIYEEIVEKIVDSLSWRLYGKYLSKEQKQIYIDNYAKDIKIDKESKEIVIKKMLHRKVIQPILQQLIMSDDYMVQ